MREIKFRAWDPYFKSMTSPQDFGWDDVMWCDNGKVHGGYNDPETGDWIEMPIMQYTGLKDKNGKEVYECDIVRCSLGCPHAVLFGGANGMPGWWLSETGVGDFGDYQWGDDEEVIGNIYENPELLEAK